MSQVDCAGECPSRCVRAACHGLLHIRQVFNIGHSTSTKPHNVETPSLCAHFFGIEVLKVLLCRCKGIWLTPQAFGVVVGGICSSVAVHAYLTTQVSIRRSIEGLKAKSGN